VAFTSAENLRERKKRDTRRRISAAGARLFAEHGFPAVTVVQIGAEAGVSAKTVFNYFPTKEEIFFAGTSPVDDRLLWVVRDRPAGESAYDALRRQAVQTPEDTEGLAHAVRERRPGETVYEAIERFRACPPPAPDPATTAARARVYLGSDALQGYAQRLFTRAEAELARLLAEDTVTEPDDPLPTVASFILFSPIRAVFHQQQLQWAAGRPPAEVAARRKVDLDRAYDLVSPALADYARR